MLGSKAFVAKADGRQKHMKRTEELWRAEERGSPARGWWCHEVALGMDMPGRAW